MGGRSADTFDIKSFTWEEYSDRVIGHLKPIHPTIHMAAKVPKKALTLTNIVAHYCMTCDALATDVGRMRSGCLSSRKPKACICILDLSKLPAEDSFSSRRLFSSESACLKMKHITMQSALVETQIT